MTPAVRNLDVGRSARPLRADTEFELRTIVPSRRRLLEE